MGNRLVNTCNIKSKQVDGGPTGRKGRTRIASKVTALCSSGRGRRESEVAAGGSLRQSGEKEVPLPCVERCADWVAVSPHFKMVGRSEALLGSVVNKAER